MSADEKQKFTLAAIDDWYFWSRVSWVRFVYVYADNEENRRLGRVGQSTGTRYGTRNLDLIPSHKKPKQRNRSTKTIRYFDTGKSKIRDASGRYTTNKNQAINGNWRSFRPGLVTIMTGIWSFERGKFVSSFDDFIIQNQPSG
ncbi:hypothetical protein FVR03_22755 [Pontibacter qinzhouensis]|uniref:Uncharacterized protein n=1 Tax=Pontibacter qinzhouensis TaxID=2603253 RepID=A0A5C8IQX8_9BACT|nr:hypothetical protein [Pontibacter qinzhouensis]TXK23322.1 hypothetical protein FVR03_22755 [Pontibacter qinzhouensis]